MYEQQAECLHEHTDSKPSNLIKDGLRFIPLRKVEAQNIIFEKKNQKRLLKCFFNSVNDYEVFIFIKGVFEKAYKEEYQYNYPISHQAKSHKLIVSDGKVKTFKRSKAIKSLLDLPDELIEACVQACYNHYLDTTRAMGIVVEPDNTLSGLFGCKNIETNLTCLISIELLQESFKKDRLIAIEMCKFFDKIYVKSLFELGYKYIISTALIPQHSGLMKHIANLERRQAINNGWINRHNGKFRVNKYEFKPNEPIYPGFHTLGLGEILLFKGRECQSTIYYYDLDLKINGDKWLRSGKNYQTSEVALEAESQALPMVSQTESQILESDSQIGEEDSSPISMTQSMGLETGLLAV